MLYAYNKTLGALPLPTASPVVTLPIATAAPSLGARGEAFDVTDELSGLTVPQYAAIQLKVADGSVELEWTDLPEFNTYTLQVGSAPLNVGEQDIEVFLDPVLGNDANPGTATSKIKTWAKGWSLLVPGKKKRRLFVTGNVVDIDSGTYIVSRPLDTGEPVHVLGTPAPSGLGTLVVTATVASSTGGARRGISAAPHVGNFEGGALLFTSGASAGRRFKIAKDDLTTFTLVNRVNTAVLAGDTFIIERPGTTLNDVSGDGFGFAGGDIKLKDVKFTMGGPLTFNGGCRVTAAENVDVEMNGAGMAIEDAAQVWPMSNEAQSLSPNPFSETLRRECGMYLKSVGGGDPIVIQRGGIYGRVGQGGSVIRDCDVTPTFGGDAQFGLVTALINCRVLGEQGKFTIVGRGSCHSIVDGSLFPGPPSIGLLIGTSADILETDQGNSLGDGILVGANSSCYLRNNLSLGANAGVGVLLDPSGVATIESPGAVSSCALTGAGGDVLVGTVTKAYVADLNGTRGFGETDGLLGPTGNRINLLNI